MDIMRHSLQVVSKNKNEKEIFINKTQKEIADIKRLWDKKISELVDEKGNKEESQLDFYKQKKADLNEELK
jgi:hypothetical protein